MFSFFILLPSAFCLFLPPCRFFAVEPQGQALGAAAGFHKFVQRRLLGLVTLSPQLGVELRTAGVGHYRAADDHRVASKPPGLGFLDGNRWGISSASAGGRTRRSRGKPDRLADGERAKASIQVVIYGSTSSSGITRQPTIVPTCCWPRASLRMR